MRLRRVLWIASSIGFGVPVASFWVWWLAFAIGIGKILDDRPFNLAEASGFALWDVLWVAIINIPLYMSLAVMWWALFRRKREMPLRGLLATAAIVGFVVPLASYPLLFVRTRLFGIVGSAIAPLGGDQMNGPLGDVLTVAILNVPICMALVIFCWALFRIGREPTLV